MACVPIVEDKYQKGVYYVDGQTWNVRVYANGILQASGLSPLQRGAWLAGWHTLQSGEDIG